jgi:hypothetical protein
MWRTKKWYYRLPVVTGYKHTRTGSCIGILGHLWDHRMCSCSIIDLSLFANSTKVVVCTDCSILRVRNYELVSLLRRRIGFGERNTCSRVLEVGSEASPVVVFEMPPRRRPGNETETMTVRLVVGNQTIFLKIPLWVRSTVSAITISSRLHETAGADPLVSSLAVYLNHQRFVTTQGITSSKSAIIIIVIHRPRENLW